MLRRPLNLIMHTHNNVENISLALHFVFSSSSSSFWHNSVCIDFHLPPYPRLHLHPPLYFRLEFARSAIHAELSLRCDRTLTTTTAAGYRCSLAVNDFALRFSSALLIGCGVVQCYCVCKCGSKWSIPSMCLSGSAFQKYFHTYICNNA